MRCASQVMLDSELLVKARELADGYHKLGRQAGPSIVRGAELVVKAAGGPDAIITERLVEDVAFEGHKGFPNNGVSQQVLEDLVAFNDVPHQLRMAAAEKSGRAAKV